MRKGDADSEESNGVYKVQRLLRHHGFDVAPDHKFGPATEGKVKEFQQDRGLSADGIVGGQTWPKLVVDVQQGMKGEHVFAVQSQWRNLAQDGDFGPNTKQRVTEFQQHNGLAVDGIVGMNTWKAMGKGPIID